MKKYTIIKTILILIISVNYLFAQQGNLTASQTLSNPTGTYGPTLIIASSLPDNFEYMHSKAYVFSSTSYRLLLVNSEAQTLTSTDATTNYNIYNNNINSTKPKYKYLNVAIDAALEAGFRRIIILEGEYQVEASIVIEGVGTSDENPAPNNIFTEKARGRITIEGEGYATRITNAPGYDGPIFSVRSYYNTIKNMSIISDTYNTGEVGRNTCIELLANQSGKKVKNNIFENLYLGAGGNSYVGNTAPPSSTEANLDSTNRRVGIKINASVTQVEFNKFKNITFNVLDTGIIIDGYVFVDPATNETSGIRVNDNIFENLTFDNVVVGVDFKAGVWAFDNVFSNLALQTDTYTKRFVRNVSGTNNTFKCLYNSDWNAGSGGNITQPNIKLFTTSSTSSHTTIKDSEIDISSDKYFEDSGSFTQLINCYNSGVINYKLGFENTSNYKSNTNLLGRVVIGKTDAAVNALDPSYNLIVNGKVRVRNEVYVKQGGLTWPDYVFAKDYKLMPLNEVEKHIQQNKHLPNMPAAAEVEKDGIAVGDLIKRQQEKIEELTLYLIEMKKEIEALKKTSKN